METPYSTHIYLICIVCVHISWCHNHPYHILVHIEAEACNKKETMEVVYDSMKEKAQHLKDFFAPGVEIGDDELVQLVGKIEDFKNSMQVADREMKASTSVFMAVHATMLEVLGEAVFLI